VKQPASELVSLSDARLARLLEDVMEELQGRMTKAGKHLARPELNQAIEAAASTLERLVQRPVRPAKQRAGSRVAEPLRSLHEAKRKAIRAALAAGVAPGQVAKHFGVPLSAIRQILAEAA
jgi:DNA-directed RNA polymerase specialized sigma24 family protein